MEDADLDAIGKRCEAATPGPWEVEPQTWGAGRGETTALRIDGVIAAFLDDEPIEADRQRRDFDFIAHARQDVPALIAEVERFRTLLRMIEWQGAEPDQAKAFCPCCGHPFDGGHSTHCGLESALAGGRWPEPDAKGGPKR